MCLYSVACMLNMFSVKQGGFEEFGLIFLVLILFACTDMDIILLISDNAILFILRITNETYTM